MPERSSIFDMIGPVMIGPSSSHTAGVVRIGRVANRILGATPIKAEITFYNSFARTYEGHGSDRAVLGGLMGFKADNPQIKESLDIARERNIDFSFKPIGSAAIHHPNTVHIHAWSDQKEVTLLGVSKGGGLIKITEVNGFSCNFSASGSTLIITAQDKHGAVAFISSVLSEVGCNIAEMTVSRKGRNQDACHFIDMDSPPTQVSIDFLRSLSWIRELRYIESIDQD